MASPELPPWPDLVWTYADAEKAPPVFAPSANAIMTYTRTLRGLARQVKKILLQNAPDKAEEVLRQYSRDIQAWANKTASNMLYGLNKNNLGMFQRQARRMGLDMRIFLNTDLGKVITSHIEENTKLICSIPRDAALKAGELAHESLITGARPEEMAKRIEEIVNTTEARARRIARTETGKAYTALTQARAESVGSEGYIWRTGRDGAVRPSHRAMEGKFVKWSEPPALDGMTGHAGEFPNCRCHPEPVIPRTDGTNRAFFAGIATQEEEKASGVKLFKSHWEKTVASKKENTVPVIPHMPGEPLFNVEKAKFEPRKLTEYSLNFDSDKGRNKARVWQATIGATKKDAADIERQVMVALPNLAAVPNANPQEYGEKFTVMVPVKGPNGKTVDVLTAWQYDKIEEESNGKSISIGVKTIPKLTTIYVDPKSTARYE